MPSLWVTKCECTTSVQSLKQIHQGSSGHGQGDSQKTWEKKALTYPLDRRPVQKNEACHGKFTTSSHRFLKLKHRRAWVVQGKSVL